MIEALAALTAPKWFLNWSGDRCTIVAPGPSAKREKALQKLRGVCRVIAIKECAVDLAPWADVAYGCDAAWWIHRRGLPDFKGLKLAWDDQVRNQFPDVELVKIRETSRSRRGAPEYVDQIIVDQPGTIGSGRNSGFQALNIAVQFGCTKIALVGFDLSGTHYYGRNNWLRAGNPDEYQFDRCRRAYAANAAELKRLGVDVANVSMNSTLNCFPKMMLTDWL